MKKALIALATLLTLTGFFQTEASAIDNSRRVTSLIREYSGRSDFEVINLGSLGLAVVKAAMRRSGNKETLELLDLMRDVKHVSIANYDDCDPEVKTHFTSRLSNLLNKENLLVEAKSQDEKIQIFAYPTDDGVNISDLIIHAPGALICVRGLIRTDAVAKMIESHSK